MPHAKLIFFCDDRINLMHWIYKIIGDEKREL
uniref:Uncharacterized protein n=1 Tax=Arundo donax TaxID=35708 RepID=A0A0A8ZML7_ARUDO